MTDAVNISRTSDSLSLALFRDHPSENWPSMERYANSLVPSLQKLAPAKWSISVKTPPAPLPTRYGLVLARMLQYPLWAKGLSGDLFHVLDHSYGQLVFALDPSRTVVTIHDVAPLRYPGRMFGISTLAWRIAWLGVSRARHIIVDSKFTATEVRRLRNSWQANVHVVPIGVSPFFRPLAPTQVETLRQRYLGQQQFLLLHVGSTQARKNLSRLMNALAQINQTVPIALVQIGGQADPYLKEQIRSLSLGACVHFLGRIGEKRLRAFYNAADLFVFPSLYEGFGLPVIEAMACDTPVACSRQASLPEVAGGAAVYFDATDSRDMADTIVELLQDTVRRQELRQHGLERASQYRWERTARLTLQVYQQVLSASL